MFTPGRLIEQRVRDAYYHKLLRLGRPFFASHETGDLVSRCSNDISFVRAAYGYGMLQLASVFITLYFGLRAMWGLDERMTIYLALPMLSCFVIVQWSIQALFRHWRIAGEQLGELSAWCFGAYRGIATIQGYHAEPVFSQRFHRLDAAYLGTNETITAARSWVLPLVPAVGGLSSFLILWMVGPPVIEGRLTLGQVTAFLGYIGMVMPPLLSLGWMLNVFSRSLPAMDRLNEVLQAECQLAELPDPQPLAKLGSWRLQVESLVKGRQGQNRATFELGPCSFHLEPGRILGITGPIGAGKTMLLDLLLRLEEIPEGCAYFQGQDVRTLALEHYRSLFSYAAQTTFLFSASLRENLQVGGPGCSDEQLLAALTQAGFDLEPAQFPKLLDTEVGEKGVRLSGGQKQRIGLARALLKGAPILVLDDVLSAVDHAAERRIIDSLRRNQSGMAILIVSHRLSALRMADEILVLERGKLTQRGRHEQLLACPGYYREIARAQEMVEG
jgi:ABC-type multidrug transport system fused ATPase/permease subunit